MLVPIQNTFISFSPFETSGASPHETLMRTIPWSEKIVTTVLGKFRNTTHSRLGYDMA